MHHARARFYFFNGKKSASYVIVVMPMRDLDVRVLLVLVLIREGSIDIFRFSVFSGIYYPSMEDYNKYGLHFFRILIFRKK